MMQSQWPADLRRFCEQLKVNLGGVFAPKREIMVARAPARLDLMAGLSDYAGAMVLSSTLQEATLVAVQKRLDRRFVIRNLDMSKDRVLNCEFRLDDLFQAGQLKSYSVLEQQLNQDPHQRWLVHLIGAVPVLLQEGLAPEWRYGANIAISSSIPLSSAVSSSASLQVAHMLALKAAYNLDLDGFQVALACQTLANRIVGAASGITDHVAVTLGQKGCTMVLRCQPHELVKMASLPPGLQWVGIFTGASLTHKESRYRDLRIASFMARKIISKNMPAFEEKGGYLCNLEMEEWEKKYRKLVLAKILGKEFIKRCATHDDPATVINPEKTYQPRPAAEHHLLENKNSAQILEWLNSARAGDPQAAAQAGQLLYESHLSYGRCGLASKETDLLVQLIQAQGPDKGLYGARVTGHGCGGTVAVLAARGSEDTLQNIITQYHNLTGLEPFLFFNSSYGAMEMGVIRVVFD